MFGLDSPSDGLKQAIAQAMIDKIVERTQGGELLPGSSRKGYSPAYKDSLAFKAAGKSNKVNMTLAGDMLATFDIVDDSDNTITLGWDDDTEQKKAFNHVTGDTVPRRDFMGLTQDDIKSLVAEFQSDIEDIKKSQENSARDELILSLIGKLTDGN